MNKLVLCSAAVAILAAHSLAADGWGDSSIWTTNVKGRIDRGWFLQIPAGSADFFNVGFPVTQGSGNNDAVTAGMTVKAVSVSVASYGTKKYPWLGVFLPNLSLDSSGFTPDLGAAIAATFASPGFSVPNQFDYATFSNDQGLSENTIPFGTTIVHGVVQLPPGDSGTLMVGGDTNTSNPFAYAFYTETGYQSDANFMGNVELGINVGQDNTVTSSCGAADRLSSGRLRVTNVLHGVGEGDHLTTTVRAGDQIELSFFGSKPGDKWRLYYTGPLCGGITPIGPVLSTVPDPDGTGSYVRVKAEWPCNFGGQTFRFAAVWGNQACKNPGVGFTNCVTVITEPENFGVVDDGSMESAWQVSGSSLPGEYMNNNFRCAPGTVTSVKGMEIAVFDFGAVKPYPKAGVSNANYSLDASGNTPDVAHPLATIAPFTFAPGTIDTAAPYTQHTFSSAIPFGLLGEDVHGWVEFPKDEFSLYVGADTSSAVKGSSFETTDSYTTAATGMELNWGLRLITN